MLTLLGKTNGKRGKTCDGVSRRSFLQVGSLALGGLTLPELLAARADGSGFGRRRIAGLRIGPRFLSGKSRLGVFPQKQEQLFEPFFDSKH